MKKELKSAKWSFGRIVKLFPLSDVKATQKLDRCVDIL
jgi:hypothetical protein